MVVDVPEIHPRVLGDERHVETHEPIADLHQRRDRALEVVDALADHLREGAAEDRLLEAVELVIERVDDREWSTTKSMIA